MLAPSATYFVDVLHAQSAEAMAVYRYTAAPQSSQNSLLTGTLFQRVQKRILRGGVRGCLTHD